MASMRSSSSVTFPLRGSGTLRGVYREHGVASGFSWMLYSSPRLPNPVKRFGKRLEISPALREVSRQDVASSR